MCVHCCPLCALLCRLLFYVDGIWLVLGLPLRFSSNSVSNRQIHYSLTAISVLEKGVCWSKALMVVVKSPFTRFRILVLVELLFSCV